MQYSNCGPTRCNIIIIIIIIITIDINFSSARIFGIDSGPSES